MLNEFAEPNTTIGSTTLSDAQQIASEWHDGQCSGLYRFCSTGWVSIDALEEAKQSKGYAVDQIDNIRLSRLILFLEICIGVGV